VTAGGWTFLVDRGGTFTDCIGISPDGALHTHKRLSSETAPVEGIRAILEEVGAVRESGTLPAATVELGTTVATNALLERRGVPTVLVTNRGLGDVLEIGTQQRPDLFALAIERVPPLHTRVLEVEGRLAPDGAELVPLDLGAAREGLSVARAAGCRAAAIVLLHAYANPAPEEALATLALEVGFEYVATSADVAREIGLLARGETTEADAYLTPLLRDHVRALRAALPGAVLRFMQSSGGLTDAERFRGPGALLSGPAGGVVGAARVARKAGFERAIGFDMGGTSTDVSLLDRGGAERAFETIVAGVRVRSPMLRIHTIAAGGGSLCRYDGFRFTVGPESAGADPGPLCYGRSASRAGTLGLALTDANHHLGRVPVDRFPFPLDGAPVAAALEALASEVSSAGHAYGPDEIAAGFVEIANAQMAQAIEEVSIRRGVDPRDFALVGFGGAGGQHVCAVARKLGMRTVLIHPLAGLLSAYGIGSAERTWDRQRDAGRRLLEAGRIPGEVEAALLDLEGEGRAALAAEGVERGAVRVERALDLRYVGTDTALTLAAPRDGDLEAAFAATHHTRFGYARSGRALEVVTARVRASADPGMPLPDLPGPAERAAAGAPAPRRVARVWFPGPGWCLAPLYWREDFPMGARLSGPALVLEATSTVVVDPGWDVESVAEGTLVLRDTQGSAAAPDVRPLDDPVRLEVFGSRFMSIAEQMGAVLRNTAVSTNIKDRLDYSCAVFGADGGLVANAPHIPVHLGAMGETVRAVRRSLPELAPGDVAVTNDPFQGGSHLPDVTVVTPVFVGNDPAFFVASRGHHADVGGKTPGSMPPDSHALSEEGVVLPPSLLVRGGVFDEASVRAQLGAGPWPARAPDDNVADLEAMVAANRTGVALLEALCAEQGAEGVAATMRALQKAAAGKVAVEIAKLPRGDHAFADAMDDGTPLVVCVRVDGARMEIDFSGTGPASSGNLNAPAAVVQAAVLYVLRALVAERIPLNSGCLEPVSVRIPEGSLLDPPPGSAVVGGNVETSQRIVDVLLGALGLAAASQGTMNNVAFGNERFGYYETIGGGAGAGDGFVGASCVHSHMTNTRITDPEVLESRFPVRLAEFSRRVGSGGRGRYPGGDGLVRCYHFLAPVTVSLLSERRTRAPFGLEGGGDGARGRNRVERADGSVEQVPGHAGLTLDSGDRLVIETPGGGGYGAPSHAGSEPSG
jgi:5-oxoprolinase (ATP-hydrolysing)